MVFSYRSDTESCVFQDKGKNPLNIAQYLRRGDRKVMGAFFSDSVFLPAAPEGCLVDAEDIGGFLEGLRACKDSPDMMFLNAT